MLPLGAAAFAELRALLAAEDARIPAILSVALRLLVRQIETLRAGIAALERQIITAARENPVMRRLATIPGSAA